MAKKFNVTIPTYTRSLNIILVTECAYLHYSYLKMDKQNAIIQADVCTCNFIIQAKEIHNMQANAYIHME